MVLSDVESARDLVRRGRKVAFVRIAEGFGEATWQLFGPGRDDPLIEVGIDPSRSAETGYLQGILMETVLGGMFERFGDRKKTAEEIARWRREVKDSADISAARKLALAAFFVALESFLASTDAISGSDPETDSGSGLAALGREQIEFVDVTRDRSSQPRTAFEISFPAAIVWGLMGCAATFAIVIVRERTAGTLLRLQIAPISWAQLLGGKGLACFLACLGTIVFILLVGRLFLGVRVGSYALLAVAASSTALCFTGMMLAMSVVGKTEPAVAGASWGMMMPLAMIGGGMVPLISMPGWMVTASHFSPFKWSIYALEGAIWRDLSLSELATPCAILLAIAGVCFTAGVWVLGRSFR